MYTQVARAVTTTQSAKPLAFARKPALKVEAKVQPEPPARAVAGHRFGDYSLAPGVRASQVPATASPPAGALPFIQRKVPDGPFSHPPSARAQPPLQVQAGIAGTARAPARANRTGLPDGLKAGIEALSGVDLSDVRVHANSAQPTRLEALAYAQGNHIHLAPGQQGHLPHEAWHVVQQKQGRVRANRQVRGVGVNDNESLEHEATTMGAKAAAYPAAASA